MSLPARKAREFERREEEILDAALALCARPDWESVTVEQIAIRAEVGKGTVYNHFESKDELLFRLMMRFYRGLLETLSKVEMSDDATTSFRHIFRLSLEYHAKNPEYRYIVPYCERPDFKQRARAEWKEDFLALDNAFVDWAVPQIEAGMAVGGFRRRPVEEVLSGLQATFKGAVTCSGQTMTGVHFAVTTPP